VKSSGSAWLRCALFLVFVVVAAAKVTSRWHYGAGAASLADRSALGIAVAVLETTLAVGFLTRHALWSCYGAMGVAVTGICISAYGAATRVSISCGCLGSMVLARYQHVALCTLIFAAALRLAPRMFRVHQAT